MVDAGAARGRGGGKRQFFSDCKATVQKIVMGSEFAGNNDKLNIVTISVPVEAGNSISIVERYNCQLRWSLDLIKKEAPDADNDYDFQLAVMKINDSIGPDSLMPTHLVFDAFPILELPTDQQTPSIFKRYVALRKATESMSCHFARRQVHKCPKWTRCHRHLSRCHWHTGSSL